MQDFELKEGRYLRFVGSNAPKSMVNKFYIVLSCEPKQYQTGNTQTAEFVAVASGAQSGYRNVSVLEPSDEPMHLAYYRWGVRDGCAYQIKIPNGAIRLGADKDMDSGRVNNLRSSAFFPSELFGFYLINDMYPAFNAINGTPESITPQVFFVGEMYEMDEVDDPQIIAKLQNFDRGVAPYIPCVKITLGGVIGGGT
jgi:hypothetical protein